MWYPSAQQQCAHRYIHPAGPSQQLHHHGSYARTSYYCNSNSDKSSMNETFTHYQQAINNDIVYESSNSEMSSSANTNWNPIIAAPRKSSVVVINDKQEDPLRTVTSSSVSSSSACWDWLLYSPALDSHLHIPSSSSFVQSVKQQDDDLDLLSSLPSWLLTLLCPSSNNRHVRRTTDEENESDQEMTSLHQHYHDEPFVSMINVEHVSSSLSLSSDPQSQDEQNRSSTPDTDDGYQSASDASRSDYSQQSLLLYEPLMTKKDQMRSNVPSPSIPHRISYAAAAVKPITTSPHKQSPLLSTSPPKSKNPSALMSTSAASTTGAKLKFIAPRFERMHHAKQYSSLSTMTVNDSSSMTNRTQSRVTNHGQRHPMVQSNRRR